MAGVIEKDFRTTVFVGNLDFTTDEEEIREFFEKIGKVDYVRIVREKKTGKSQGFCYVKFAEKESVEKAIKLKNRTLKDRELRIFKAKKQDVKSRPENQKKKN